MVQPREEDLHEAAPRGELRNTTHDPLVRPLRVRTSCFLFQVSQKELKEALRRQWSQLSDKRRLKWISKALELQKDYEVPNWVRLS